MNEKGSIIRLGKQLEAENAAAFDLSTWLPSRQLCQMYHGDYADEFTPSNAVVMAESCTYISFLLAALTMSESEIQRYEESEMWTQCWCGEEHTEADVKPTFAKKFLTPRQIIQKMKETKNGH